MFRCPVISPLPFRPLILTGELLAVSHQQIGYPVETLMSDIQYNVFGQQTYQLYGNGVESFYTYLPQRQWLTTKQTRIPSSSQIQELHYKYDDVGNITQIKQNASSWSSLGGSYTNDYTYDRQYRLLSATEASSPTFNVAFSADYSPAGRLGHNFCVANYVNKDLTYGYDINGLTHQPRVILDGKSKLPYDLYWDANGNLAQVVQCDYSEVRFHEWDDSNRLHAVIGPKQAGFYGYDGNGDRVWKLTGSCSNTSQNGGMISYDVYIDDAVLYPNPYLTITPTGYTKHYYIGSERIATALGEGGWGYASVNLNVHDNEVVDNFFENYMNELPCEQCSETGNEDIYGDRPSALQYSCKPQCLRGIKLLYAQNGYLYNEIIQHEISSGKQESLFFTHSDHLGSASWITDSQGEPVQYIHYAPYGELIANQNAYGSSYDERYKFTGKERDAESGYDNFGARYLLSDAGIWLSVDPLVDKYLGISPYAYCAWNPIKYIDPDGRMRISSPLIEYLALARTMEHWQGNSDVKTVGYSMLHPLNAIRTGTSEFPIGSISNIACRFQVNLENEAGFSKGIGGQSNAFRHTLWQAMLANTFGPEQAVRIGNAHEDNLPKDMSTNLFLVKNEADTMADFLNNTIGREIAANNKGLSNKQYAELVLKEFKTNGLWIVTGNEKDGYYVQRSKLPQEQYDRALQVVKTRGNNGLLE